MRNIGIGHRGILAHDVHAADLSRMHGVHDLHDREARLRIERAAPQRLELGFRRAIVDALVVGIHHRDQADVGRALHVVLAAQRMQPGARAAHLAGEHRERDQAAGVVGAVNVLRDAHAPEDHRRARRREKARHLADRRRRDAAQWRHRLRTVRGDIRLERIETQRAVRDETLRD